jgi:hypothetical protein
MALLDALILSLPTRNSTVRMRVWRALKDTGCGVLRDGVYVLPQSETASAALGEMESQILASGGSAMRVEINLKTDEQQARLPGLFDRSREYVELSDQIKQARASLRRLGPRKSQTSVERLERQLEKISLIDFYPGSAKAQVSDAFATLKNEYRQLYAGGEPRVSQRRLRPADKAKFQGRVWATRKSPWVDRLACAWLIKRFIDKAATFAWLERPSALPRKAVGYDFDGAEFTHVGNRVTFEVLAETFALDKDRALSAIAASVHFLDVGGIPSPDAKGLETVLKGVKEKARSDDALLAEAMRIFDHFYSAYAEEHTAST